MIVEPIPPNPLIFDILRRYAAAEISCTNAAWEIMERNIPGLDDVSASEVILWSKMAGFGIPDPGREQAEKEAAELMARRARRKSNDADGG